MLRRTFLKAVGLSAVIPSLPLIRKYPFLVYKHSPTPLQPTVNYLGGEVNLVAGGCNRLVKRVNKDRVDWYSYNSDNNLISHKYKQYVLKKWYNVQYLIKYDRLKRPCESRRDDWFEGDKFKDSTTITVNHYTGKQTQKRDMAVPC